MADCLKKREIVRMATHRRRPFPPWLPAVGSVLPAASRLEAQTANCGRRFISRPSCCNDPLWNSLVVRGQFGMYTQLHRIFSGSDEINITALYTKMSSCLGHVHHVLMSCPSASMRHAWRHAPWSCLLLKYSTTLVQLVLYSCLAGNN